MGKSAKLGRVLLLLGVLCFTSLFYYVFSPKEGSVKATTEPITYDLADSANWNVRIDGAAASDYYAATDVGSSFAVADFNGRGDSGSLYVIYNGLFSSYSGTGNNILLSDTSNFTMRFDGAGGSNYLSYRGTTMGDLDGDNMPDLGVGAIILADY